MYNTQISKNLKLVLDIIFVVSMIAFLTNAYIFWRNNHLTSVIRNELDGRAIEAISLTTNSNEITLETDDIEYFVNNIFGYNTNTSSSLINAPSYLEWEEIIYRRPFQSIAAPVYLMEIQYADDTNSNIFFTQSEIEIDKKLFKAPNNA